MTVRINDHRIDTGHASLFARTWTPDRPQCDTHAAILLFHDSLGCVKLWRDFPERLAESTQRIVVAYDRLGFGFSDAHPGPLPLSFIGDEAARVTPLLCDSLRLNTIVPFGHSVGGVMAIATAALLPDRCSAVVTEAAQSFVEERTLDGLRSAGKRFEQPGQLERLARYHGPKARWVLDAWIETWLAPSFAQWRLDDELRQVRCPVLAMHGDRDEFGSTRHPGTDRQPRPRACANRDSQRLRPCSAS
jgi:pimeloyl-ACP methyl ester carboxylesterase